MGACGFGVWDLGNRGYLYTSYAVHLQNYREICGLTCPNPHMANLTSYLWKFVCTCAVSSLRYKGLIQMWEKERKNE